MRILTTYPEIT